jgi:hypothetical protein
VYLTNYLPLLIVIHPVFSPERAIERRERV